MKAALAALCVCAGGLALSGCVLDVASFGRTEPLRERTVRGEGGPKIAMLELSGVISQQERSSPLGIARPSPVARALEALDLAAKDDDVRALLLRVNSPGGSVAASETLYHAVERWKQETGRPVVAYFDGIATSGGYYVAMAADELVAHPTTITGSIGVIMSGINLAGLMERYGVTDQSFTSGSFKDAGSPLRKMRPEERAHLEGIVDDLHARFQRVVERGRPELDSAKIEELADGRIFTARQAAELGLIDRVGHLEHAVRAVEQRIGAEESRVVVYARPSEYRSNLYSRRGGPPVQLVDIDLLPFEASRLEPGFYYLWPPALFSR